MFLFLNFSAIGNLPNMPIKFHIHIVITSGPDSMTLLKEEFFGLEHLSVLHENIIKTDFGVILKIFCSPYTSFDSKKIQLKMRVIFGEIEIVEENLNKIHWPRPNEKITFEMPSPHTNDKRRIKIELTPLMN